MEIMKWIQFPLGECHEEGIVKNCTEPPFLGNPQNNVKIQEKGQISPAKLQGKNEIKISRKRKYMLIIEKKKYTLI